MIECPHCNGAIDLIAAAREPDRRQGELPFMVELKLPQTKNAKKVIDDFWNDRHASRGRDDVHGHVHDLRKAPKEKALTHEHDHVLHQGELTPAQEDLLDQVEELVAIENRTQHFRTTWIMRIRDYPNQVFAAIGEARTAKREGKVRKSVGGVLNWHFEKFREGARVRRCG